MVAPGVPLVPLVPERRAPRPWAMLAASVAVAAVLALPLVFLLIEAHGAGVASLRGADPVQEEVSRALGVGRVRTFLRVTLGQARGAILGGCLLIALMILAEYGAFEILGFQTFTTEIFTEFTIGFSVPAACALSLVLVLLSVLVLGGETAARGRGRTMRAGPMARRMTRRHPLGRAKIPVLLAAPGLVIALALSYFSERYAGGIGYQSQALLIIAYAVLFFPLALTGVRASVTQAPVTFDEAARALGQRRLAVLRRVTLPIVMPGLAAAFCLVFLSGVTELTATLILIPTGVQTLATQFWAYQQNLSYGQAAPFALVIIAVAAVPSYVMGRWFDRLPERSEKLS